MVIAAFVVAGVPIGFVMSTVPAVLPTSAHALSGTIKQPITRTRCHGFIP